MAAAVLLAAAAGFNALLTSSHAPVQAPGEAVEDDSVVTARLTILVDNKAEPGLAAAWGLSVLVNASGHLVLFDTGPDPRVLLANAARLGVNLSEVEAVVISHRHLDHTGGIAALTPYRDRLRVYVPAPDRGLAERLRGMGFHVYLVGSTVPVVPGVYAVKPLEVPGWDLYEEGLAVKVEGVGLVVLGGCSHPGIERIAAQASRDLGARPFLVLGGFHLAGQPGRAAEAMESLIEMGARYISPIHCSGREPVEWLRSHAPGRLLLVRAGDTVVVGAGGVRVERLGG